MEEIIRNTVHLYHLISGGDSMAGKTLEQLLSEEEKQNIDVYRNLYQKNNAGDIYDYIN